jgi:N,N-dimethylformamidase beta subunit-like, C-terminal
MSTVTASSAAALVAALSLLASGSNGVLPAEIEEDEELEGRAPTAIELVPSVEAAFRRESYAPGETATLVVRPERKQVRLQLFRVGPERATTRGNNEMQGIPVTREREIDDGVVPVEVGDWPSGLYFARLEAADGRVGFAPFVVRPRELGASRVAIVLPTLTWQAYNLRDGDGDGKPDSWYGDWKRRTIRLGRPFLNRGVPYHFRRYDLPFLHWLSRSGRTVDVLTDEDLDELRDGAELAVAYDLIVFPGHHEYVTTHEYDVVERYRDLGGNLAFLSANNFFWQVVKRGAVVRKTKQWRDLGRPEAGLLGVQYRGNDSGESRGAWIVQDTPAASWLLAGLGLRPGSRFGNGGIEIDCTAPDTPDDIEVIAEIPDLFGTGFTAQMTYYETKHGTKVFAAGAFTLAGSALNPEVSRVLANLWGHLARP